MSLTRSQFEALVHRHHAAVYRSARRVLDSDADARDVAQEVFLRVLDGRLALPEAGAATGPEEGPDAAAPRVGALLGWWAVRVALNERRGARRRRAREERAMRSGIEAGAGAERGDLRLERDDERRALWEHVESLPRDLRVALMLRFAESRTYREIAELCGVAEASAHDRVGRALEKLRARLTSAGLAGFLPHLERRLGQVEPGPAPEDCLPRLLAAPAAVAAPGLAALLPIAGTVLAALVAVAAGVRALRERPSAAPISAAVAAGPRAVSGTLAAAASGERRAPRVDGAGGDLAAPALGGRDPSAAARGAAPWGTVVGRVLERGGPPLPGVAVVIASVELSGKQAAYGAETITDARGLFQARVELADADGGMYTVRVATAGYATRATEPRRVQAGGEADFGELVLERMGGEGRGRFTLDVLVLGPDERPVPGALVQLGRVVDLPVPEGTLWPSWMHRERAGERDFLELVGERQHTDGQGLARIEGEFLGEKLLRVRPGGKTLAPQELRVAITSASAERRTVRLGPAVALRGTLLAAEGGVAQNARVWAIGVPAEGWQFGAVDAAGSFVIDGLAPEEYILRADAPGRSPVEVEARAGGPDLELVLARVTDAASTPGRLAELHGQLVEAETGAPLVVEAAAVEVDWIGAEPGFDWEADVLPNEVFRRPVQTAAFGEPPPPSAEFHLTGLQPGRYLVRASVAGRGNAVAGPFELERGASVRDLRLALAREVVLAARVEDPEGRRLGPVHVFLTGIGPHSDALVRAADDAYRAADGRGWIGSNGSGRIAREGRHEWRGLPPGLRVRAVALHPDWRPAVGPPFVTGNSDDPGETTEVVLRFEHRFER